MNTATTIEPGREAHGQAGTPSLFATLPEELQQSLSPSQRESFEALPASKAWKRHSVDIRLNLPFFGGYYLAVIGGREKRSPHRRVDDRQSHPLRTIANTFFFMGFGAIFAVLALFAMALQSAIVEF